MTAYSWWLHIYCPPCLDYDVQFLVSYPYPTLLLGLVSKLGTTGLGLKVVVAIPC